MQDWLKSKHLDGQRKELSFWIGGFKECLSVNPSDREDRLYWSDWLARAARRSLGVEYGSQRKKRFVIMSLPRCGSHLLCFLLDRQDEIICCAELFNKDEIYWTSKLARDIAQHTGRSAAYRNKHPRSFLWRFWCFDTDANLGFKYLIGVNPIIDESLIRDQRARKILLNRKNKIKRHVSLAIARQTNEWVRFDRPPTEQARVTIVVQEMIDSIRAFDRQYERVRRELVSSGQSFKEIYYEDLLGGRRIQTLSELADFLKCRDIDEGRWAKEQIFKQNSENLEDLVLNYSELRESLKDTEYEQYLY